MALVENQLFDLSDGPPQYARVIVKPNGRKVKTFLTDAGAALLARYTPVVRGSSTGWRAWADTDEVVHGFTAEPVQLSASGEVQGVVLLALQISYHDIALPAGITEATLKASLRAGSRELGMDILDLDDADRPATDNT